MIKYVTKACISAKIYRVTLTTQIGYTTLISNQKCGYPANSFREVRMIINREQKVVIIMEQWQVHYQDKQHDLNCVIENLYDDADTEQPLKMCIDGVTFWGSGFDDWELSSNEQETDITQIMQRFSLLKYGYKEQGYHYWLQAYRMQITIPTILFSWAAQCKLPAKLDIIFHNQPQDKATAIYRLDGERVIPNTTICERFALVVADQCFAATNPSEFFEISLQSISKQITGIYYLCNCFGCLYSDYNPYGQGNIGNLCCFVANKEKYLQVYSKYEGTYTIWDAFADGYIECQETAVCEQFAPRINCLGGYRGKIYKF